MASTRIRGITIELGADTSGISTALKNINGEIRDTSKQLKDVERLLKLDPTNTELLAQKQRLLADKIGETKTKLESLKKAQEEVGKKLKETGEGQKEYDALSREIVNCEEELKAAQTEAAKFNSTLESVEVAGKKLDEVSKKVKDVGDNVTNLGQKMTTKLSVPLAALGGASLKSFIDFESAFTGVKKTVDATEDEYQELEDWIKQASTEMASSKEDIAKAMEVAGQLGVRGVGNLEQFTKTMVELGDTTNLSAEEAATQLARFMNITKTAYSDSDKLGSVIVDLGNNFATSESDIVAMASRLAGAGHQIGLSEAQIMGFATALSSVGIEAEMGGSAFSKAMIKMQVAAETGYEPVQELLQFTAAQHGIDNLRDLQLAIDQEPKFLKTLGDELGMTTKEIKATIDAGGNLNSFAETANMTTEDFVDLYRNDAPAALQAFIQGLGDTEGKGQSTIAMLEDMGFTEVRLRDTLTRLAGSGDLVTDAVDKANTAWDENNALTEEAEKRYSTTESQIQQTKEKLSNVTGEIGERLLPYLDKLLNTVDDLVKKWDSLSTEEQDQIVQIGLVIAAVGPLLMVLGQVISTIGSVGSAISFLMANPIAALIAAIIALVVLIALKGDEIQAVLGKLDSYLQNVFARDWTKTFGILGNPINALFAIVRDHWNNLKTIFNGVIDFIRGVFTGDWKRALKGIGEIAAGEFNSIALLTKIPINAAIMLLNSLIDGINKFAGWLNGLDIDIPDWVPEIGGRSFSPNIPTLGKIPYLAKGGILTQGSAIVGEAGAELLTMVNGRAVVQPLTTNNNSYAGNTNNFYIQSNDPYAVAEQVSEILEHQTNQMREAWA